MSDISITNDMNSADGFLRLQGISKSFPGVCTLNNVHLEIRKGEVHALVGENGAGKSTLMKILSGAYTKDEDELETLTATAVACGEGVGTFVNTGVDVVSMENIAEFK